MHGTANFVATLIRPINSDVTELFIKKGISIYKYSVNQIDLSQCGAQIKYKDHENEIFLCRFVGGGYAS